MTDYLAIKSVDAQVYAENALTAVVDVTMNRRPTEAESALSRTRQEIYADSGQELPLPTVYESSDSFTISCSTSDVEEQLHAHAEGLRLLSENAAHLQAVINERRGEVAEEVKNFLSNS